MSWNNKTTSIAIVGRRGSGKTSLSYHVLKDMKKQIYVYRHPKPHLIKALGYDILYSFEDMEHLQDCVLWVDEPQLYLKTQEKQANHGLLRLLSIARQRGVCLLISTSDTRFITRGLESYIDVWLIKDIETNLVKRGSLISKIIKKNTFIDEDGFRLYVNEYLFYSRDFPELEGRYSFDKPIFFNDEYSKPFRTATPTANRSANESAKDTANITDIPKPFMVSK